jgi:DNA-binding transcriptional LysR family regulator
MTTSHLEMDAFVRSADLGSFTAAARALQLTPSALSKLIGRLEARLGVRLLHRTTRKLAPTVEGTLYLERCRQILNAIGDAESEVSRLRERPRGKLRLHAGVAFGTRQLVPRLPHFSQRYPEVQVELNIDDRTVDLFRDGGDIAIRTGPLRDAALVAKKLCDIGRLICASPTYLSRRGIPRTPADLATHNCITMAGIPNLSRWPFDTPSGKKHFDVQGNITVNNAECLVRLAVMGHGLIRINEAAISDEMQQGLLIPVLSDHQCRDAVALHALYPPGHDRLPRVSAMLDFLEATFSSAPWRNVYPGRARPSRPTRAG